MGTGNDRLYVVAIGASAGGLEAFSQFFDNAGPARNVAYILIQHLAPGYKSLLAELLSKHTKMVVKEAEHGMEVQSANVYVIPPKKKMTIADGMLQLVDKDPEDKGPNTSIDTFFHSLAREYEDKAIAVVLSGTGSDGSRGIEAVKQYGGYIIVQDPADAKFDGMPQSSIATGCADAILPVKRMHDEILSYMKGTASRSNLSNEELNWLKRIFAAVEKQTGSDFENYKMPTILRRLEKRMNAVRMRTMEEYVTYLEKKPEEAHEFLKDLLIGVTKFFRDRDAFAALEEKVLRPLIDSKNDYDTIKIWVTACSTGEEAYTVAILVDSLLKKMKRSVDVKIFATDLNTQYIERASKGVYDPPAERDIPAEYLHTYFVRRDNSISVVPYIRKQIVFARHNLITDPPFIKNDLVCCRNMLIYVDQQLQRQIFGKFTFAINYKGFLFLGPSENLVADKTIMTEVDRKWKLYQKTAEVAKMPYSTISYRRDRRLTTSTPGQQKALPAADKLQSFLMEDFGISAFLLDSNFAVLEDYGNYTNFIGGQRSELTGSLPDMLPPTLALAVKNGVANLERTKKPQVETNNLLRLGDKLYNVTVSVRYAEGDAHFLVSMGAFGFGAVPEDFSSESVPGDIKLEAVTKELQETKFKLHTAIEELETTNEELQSGNEELLSANEELQSSNEELQSLNEELHTLNTEHQQRIKELAELNDDLNNYFKGSNIGQVIIDRRMLIRKFNPSAVKMINLIDRDINRRITDITKNFQYDHFEDDIERVLVKNTVIERELNLHNGKTVLLRINSYLTNEQLIDGALLSFIDITEYRTLYNIIEGVFRASDAAIVVLQPIFDENEHIDDFRVVKANTAAHKLFNTDSSEKPDGLFAFNAAFAHAVFKDLLKLYHSGKLFQLELELEGQWFHTVAVKIPNGVALTLNNVTAQKNAEMKLRRSYNEIYTSKEQLREINTNLEAKVAERTRELAISEERFRLISSVTNDVVVDWNLATGEFWVGSNYTRLLGYAADQVRNNREFWLEKIHPDDRKNYTRTIAEAMKHPDRHWLFTYKYRGQDGGWFTITDRGFFILDESGTPYRMLSSMLVEANGQKNP